MVAKANEGKRPAHLLGTIRSLAILYMNPTCEKLFTTIYIQVTYRIRTLNQIELL